MFSDVLWSWMNNNQVKVTYLLFTIIVVGMFTWFAFSKKTLSAIEAFVCMLLLTLCIDFVLYAENIEVDTQAITDKAGELKKDIKCQAVSEC